MIPFGPISPVLIPGLLAGRTVSSAELVAPFGGRRPRHREDEFGGYYIVLRFDDGLTLYADAPTAYKGPDAW